MKFKKGDRVKVKDNSKCMFGRYAGKPGTVSDVLRGDTYPYEVSLDDDPLEGEALFHAIELERI